MTPRARKGLTCGSLWASHPTHGHNWAPACLHPPPTTYVLLVFMASPPQVASPSLHLILPLFVYVSLSSIFLIN